MDLNQIMQITSVVSFILMTLTIMFGVYNIYIKNNKDTAKEIANTEKTDLTIDSKIQLIANEVKHLTDSILLIKQNDLHSIFEKQRDQDSQIGKLTVSIEKLTTIIEERVPKKV